MPHHTDEQRTTLLGCASVGFGVPVLYAAIKGIRGENVHATGATTVRRPRSEVEAAWRENPPIADADGLRFDAAPGDRGTEVRVTVRYRQPAGPLGAAMSRLRGDDPRQRLDDELRRFKQVLETGEVVRSDGAPGGKRARQEFPQRPARPMSSSERSREVQR